MNKKRCYNCGIPFSKENPITSEHIPMKALYRDFPDDYKKKLLTVPACSVCNNKYSKIEEDFRNIIALWSLNENVKLPQNLLFKSILSKKIQSEVQRIEGYCVVNFNMMLYNDVHIKNFKGLFYAKYNSPLPIGYKIIVFADISDKIYYPNIPIPLKELIKERFDDEKFDFIGHKDIFQHQITDIGLGFQCRMLYFGRLFATVYALKSI